jgi:hypothetical protein
LLLDLFEKPLNLISTQGLHPKVTKTYFLYLERERERRRERERERERDDERERERRREPRLPESLSSTSLIRLPFKSALLPP